MRTACLKNTPRKVHGYLIDGFTRCVRLNMTCSRGTLGRRADKTNREASRAPATRRADGLLSLGRVLRLGNRRREQRRALHVLGVQLVVRRLSPGQSVVPVRMVRDPTQFVDGPGGFEVPVAVFQRAQNLQPSETSR